MTTYNTGNALGSGAAKDIYDNAQNLDHAVNDQSSDNWVDRLGKSRKTWSGIEHEARDAMLAFGYVTVDSFEDGATITLPNQVLRYESTGEYYRWDGAIPENGKVVPAGSTPETAGGIGSGLWLSVGDAVLRSQISDENGFSLYPELQMSRWKENGDIRYWGAKMDGVTDDTNAINSAFSSGSVVRFPRPVNGPAIISASLIIPDDLVVIGPGSEHVIIKCSDAMDPDLHAMVSKNYYNGITTANKNISISGVCIDGNGYTRAPGTDKPDGCNFVINAENTKIINCKGVAAPLWNLFVTSGNPFAEVGHNGTVLAPSKRILINTFFSVDPIHGDGGIVQGTWDSTVRDYTSTYTDDLVALGIKVRADTGIQVIEGCRDVTVENVMADHNDTVTTAVGVGAHANKPYVKNITIKGVVGNGLNTLIGVFNDTSVIGITDSSWNCKGISISNVVLNKPIADSSSTVMQARLVDVQNMHDVSVSNATVNLSDEDGSYNSPTAIINFDGARNAEIDGAHFNGAPAITTTLNVARATGWVVIRNANNSNVSVKNVSMDSAGYFNRVIGDSTSNALVSVNGIKVLSLPSDSQTKEGIVSGSAILDVRNISLPSGMTQGRFSGLFTAISGTNVDVKQSAPRRTLGSQQVRAFNNSGVQAYPTLVLERGYVGTGGKGNLAFWTSDSTLGTLGVGAWNEDSATFTPVHITAYQPAQSVTKYLSPAVNGDTNLGNSSTAWLNGYFVNAPQTVSDATLKTDPRDMSDVEINAFYEIGKLPMAWKWLNRIEEEGDTARWHSGPTVQAAIAIMVKYGLDWTLYSCFCYDHQEAVDAYTVKVDPVTDSDGTVLADGYEYEVPAVEESDKYSFRKEELSWWCMRAIQSKIDDQESRLAALEAK